MDKEKNLIPEDDYEYEKMLAQKAKEEREKAETEKIAAKERQKQEEKQGRRDTFLLLNKQKLQIFVRV